MSLSFMMSRSSPSILTSVPDHLPNRILSPALTSSGVTVPSSLVAPAPTGDDFALLRLFLGGVGDDDPAGRLFLGLDAADEHAIMERTEGHKKFPLLVRRLPIGPADLEIESQR